MSKPRHKKKSKQQQQKGKLNVLPITRPERSKIGKWIAPTEIDLTLPFIRLFVASGAAASITKRFNPNSLYRPDPVSFAHSAMGVAEWQALFSLYRVIRYSHESTASNEEDFAVEAGCTNTNADPSTSQGATELMNDLAVSAHLERKGSGKSQHTFKQTFNVATVVGSGDIEYDDDYRGLLSSGSETSPADLIWIGNTAQSVGGSNLTNGVSWTFKLWMTVRIYDRQILSQGTAFTSDGTPVHVLFPVVSEQRKQEREKDQQRKIGVVRRPDHIFM